MPPPEFADEGVYCTGDECHKIRAEVGEAARGGDAAEVEHCGGVVGGRIWGRQRFGREKCADSLWRYHSCDSGIGDNESKLAPTIRKTVQESRRCERKSCNGKGMPAKKCAKNGASESGCAERLRKKPRAAREKEITDGRFPER